METENKKLNCFKILLKAAPVFLFVLFSFSSFTAKANGCTGSNFSVQYSHVCGCWQICGNYISDCDLLFNVIFNFGDGSPPYNGQDPCHHYTVPGTYTITMTVSGLCHFRSMTCHITQQVTVTQAQLNNIGVVANFTADTVCQFTSTQFTNTSYSSTSWYWDFGDGSLPSFNQNPAHLFDSCGTYPVTLIITDNTPCCGMQGRDTITKMIYVNCAPEEQSNNLGDTSLYIYESSSMFSADTACHHFPTTFNITPHDSVINWSWQFSDGGGAGTVFSPSHTYNTCQPHANNYADITITNTRGCTNTYRYPAVVYCEIGITTTITDEICGRADGQIVVTATGGSGNYLYSIDSGATYQTGNVFSGLTGGNYPILVTDVNGTCTSYNPFPVVVALPGPDVSLDNIDNPSCFGDSDGSIDISVSGGRGPYTYNWSTTATTQDISSVANGSYIVTVTDFDLCEDIDTINVIEPALFTGAVSVVNILCYGWNSGTAVLNMTGGTPTATYIWTSGDTTPSASNLAAGTYYVTATDGNGCIHLDTAVVTQAPEIVATATTNNSNCGSCDGSATVTVTGGTGPFNYQWDASAANQITPTATLLCAGIYHLEIAEDTIPFCTKNITVAIGNIGAEAVSVSTTNILCYGACTGSASVTIPGGCLSPPCDIQWYDSLGTVIGLGFNINGLCEGDYIVRVINGINCITFENFSITEPAPFDVVETVDHISCVGLCDGSITVAVSGGTIPYTYQWYDALGNLILSGTNVLSNRCAGNYSLVLSDLNSCADTFNFTILPSTLSATAVSSNISCFGDCLGTAQVTASSGTLPYSYQWLDNLGNAITGQTSAAIDSLCVGNYSVDVSDSTGCTVNVPVSISQPTQLTGNTFATDLPCSGDCMGSAFVTAGGGTAPYQFQWTDSSGVYLRDENAFDIDTLCPGTYHVIITDTNECFTTIPVIINEPLALALTGVVTNVSCNGANDGGVNITVIGGTPTNVFVWNGTPAGEDLAGVDGGIYGVVVTDGNGCTITDTFVVNEPAVLTDSIYGRDIICNGANDGFAGVSVSGGVTPYSYIWNPGGQNDSIAIDLFAGTYRVTITDSSGCIITDSITLTEPGPMNSVITITPYFGGFHVECFGGKNDTVSVLVTGGIPPYDYVWSNGVSNDTIANVFLGTYTVTVTDSVGCAIIDSVVLSIEPPLITISNTFSNPTCFDFTDGSIDITIAGGTPPYFYFWRRDTTLSSIDTNVISISPDLNGLNYGVYYVNVLDTNGCFISDTIVLINPPPLPPFNDSVQICGNDSIFLGGAYQTTPGLYYDTLLSLAGCDSVIITDLVVVSFFFTQVPVTICENESHFAGGAFQTTAGLYYDSLISNTLCDSIVETNLTVLPLIPLDSIYNICDGDSVLIGGVYRLVADTYYDTLPGTLTCDTIVQATLNVFPIIPPVGTNAGVCPDETAPLDAGVYQSYLWSPGGQTTQVITVPAGTYTVNVTDFNGCRSSGQFVITESIDMDLRADPDSATVVYGDNITVNIISGSSVNINNLSWSPITGLSCPTCDEVTIQPENDQNYMIVALDDNGCPDTAYVEIIVDRSGHIYVPNAFSPNDDGENDVFYAYVRGWKQFRMLVYDRWGEKLFESDDPNIGWDGTFRGEPKNPGVYIYFLDIVFINGVEPPEYINVWKGSVTLIR